MNSHLNNACLRCNDFQLPHHGNICVFEERQSRVLDQLKARDGQTEGWWDNPTENEQECPLYISILNQDQPKITN